MKIMSLRYPLCWSFGITKSLINHGTIFLWRNRFGFHLLLSLEKLRLSEKGNLKSNQYYRFLRLQWMFLDSVRIFDCPNSIVVDITWPLREKRALSLHRLFHSKSKSTTIQAKNWSSKVSQTSESLSCNKCICLILWGLRTQNKW